MYMCGVGVHLRMCQNINEHPTCPRGPLWVVHGQGAIVYPYVRVIKHVKRMRQSHDVIYVLSRAIHVVFVQYFRFS